MKIIFTPGVKFQEMLSNISIECLNDTPKGGEGDKGETNGPDDDSGGEAPDPAA